MVVSTTVNTIMKPLNQLLTVTKYKKFKKPFLAIQSKSKSRLNQPVQNKLTHRWEPHHTNNITRYTSFILSGGWCSWRIFDLSQKVYLHVRADTFNLMTKLRFQKYLPQIMPFLNKLTYLEWNGYPLKSLPQPFCVEQLIQICLPHINIGAGCRCVCVTKTKTDHQTSDVVVKETILYQILHKIWSKTITHPSCVSTKHEAANLVFITTIDHFLKTGETMSPPW